MICSAAVTYTESFSSGSGFFTPLQETNVDTSSGALTFQSSRNNPIQNGQGSGVTLDLDQDGVLGSSFSNSASAPLYFQFDSIVPAADGAQDELGFYFGPPSGQAQSSNITNGQNTNGFTFYFNDRDLVAQSSSGSMVTILSDLGVGSDITFDIEWSLAPAQNAGQFNNFFSVTASGTNASGASVTNTESIAGARDQGVNQIDAYQFTVSSTRGLTGTLDNFTVSDMPIPEPGVTFLSLLGASALLFRRRHG